MSNRDRSLEDRIVEIVRRGGPGGTTHGELLNHLGNEHRGDESVGNDATNTVMLCGLSTAVADAIIQLFADKRLEAHPCDPMVMLFDGCPIPANMPMAKRPPAGGYKHPHFLPVVLQIPAN